MDNDKYVRSYGVIPSKTDVRDYQLTFEAIDPSSIPDVYASPLPPFDKKQNGGICTNASISRWFERQYKLAHDIDQEFSMTWLYAHKSDITTSGAQLRDILKLANTLGDCKNELFPFNVDVPELIDDLNKSNITTIEADSKQHILKGFAQLQDINSVKLAIMKYSYVYCAIPWYSDCTEESVDLSSTLGDYEILVHPGKQIGGYHAILLYGWDKYGWRFVNTWGNMFGKDDCAVLTSDYNIIEYWSLIGDKEESQNNPSPTPIVPIIHKKSSNEIIQLFWKIINWIINNIIKNIKK